MANNEGLTKEEKVITKLGRFWYFVVPYIFTVLSLAGSFIRFLVERIDNYGTEEWYYDLRLTSFFDGNPNIIAILGVISMFLCLLIIPKSMLKERKSGDGLGLMFIPLGFLGIFQVMCTIENVKDMVLGISFGVVLFIISALGTFKKTMKIVAPLCVVMMIAGLYCILAGYMPYCYSKLPKFINKNTLETFTGEFYYVSYFVRDEFLLAAYGIFAARLTKKYKELDEAKNI